MADRFTAAERAWAFAKLAASLDAIPETAARTNAVVAVAAQHAGGQFCVDRVTKVALQVEVAGARFAVDLGALLARLSPADYADLIVPLDPSPIAKREGDA